jgi:hypothetical protein
LCHKKSDFDVKVKSDKFKAREFHVMSRTYRTPQLQGNEAQRRSWTFYEAANFIGIQPRELNAS